MIKYRDGRPPTQKNDGFTLIEIMVSIGFLFIIILLLAQITKDMTAMVQRSNRGMDGDAQARQVFGLLARDLAGMPNRMDMDYSLFKHSSFTLPSRYNGTVVAANSMLGNDSLAFVADGAAGDTTAGNSAMALIVWKMGTQSGFKGPVLQRLRLPLAWEPGTSDHGSPIYLPNTILGRVPDALTRTDGYLVAGEYVFRMEYQYWLRADSDHPARMSVTPYRSGSTIVDAPLRQASSLVVTVAVLDAESRKICGNLDALVQSLPDAVDGKDTAEVWNGIIQNPGFAAMVQIQPAAVSGVRIYQRFLSLPALE